MITSTKENHTLAKQAEELATPKGVRHYALIACVVIVFGCYITALVYSMIRACP